VVLVGLGRTGRDERAGREGRWRWMYSFWLFWGALGRNRGEVEESGVVGDA